MSARLIAFVLAPLALGSLLGAQEVNRLMDQVRLMTLDPGHFHAALVQKEMYPGVATVVHVYAPLGPGPLRPSGARRRASTAAPRTRRPGTSRCTPGPTLRADAARAPGQRGRPLGPQPREDRPDPGLASTPA